jgi:hypothetical protein
MEPPTEKNKKKLFDVLRKMYFDNKEQLRLIKDFELNYTSEDAIWWYSNATFVYQVLNKALRDHDFDVLIAFRFFIVDLYKSLSIEHQKYLCTLSESDLNIYRGQGISEEELTLIRNNVEEFISMNSFLSTTTLRTTGEFFADSSATGKDSTKRILFEFKINRKLLNTKPFACIRDLSQFAEEDEVLIALGTIFRIMAVTYNRKQDMWIATLELCTEDDFVLKDILEYEKKKLGETRDYISLGRSLIGLGEYDKAKNLFQDIINESNDDLETMICFHYLNDIHRYQRNWMRHSLVTLDFPCHKRKIMLEKKSIWDTFTLR